MGLTDKEAQALGKAAKALGLRMRPRGEDIELSRFGVGVTLILAPGPDGTRWWHTNSGLGLEPLAPLTDHDLVARQANELVKQAARRVRQSLVRRHTPTTTRTSA